MLNRQVLILDDDPAFRTAVREGLRGLFGVVEAGSEGEFRAVWRARRFDLLLLDMRLRRDREGLDVLREVFAQDECQPVIMVSAYGDTESAIEAVGAGAMMFLHKREFSPGLMGRMMEAVIEQGRLRRQVQGLRRQVWSGQPEMLLGSSAGIREAAEALRVAAHDRDRWPVVLAEQGSGASLAALLLHRAGEAAEGLFLEVSAGAIEADGEVFFEGNRSPWVQSEGGTLAVDGAEGLRQELGRAVLKRGGVESRNVVFLLHEGAEGKRGGTWRTELPRWLARVSTLAVRLPPLRERREDIPLLAAHFLQGQRAGGHTTARSLSGAAMARLEAHHWPGNVRELRNAVEYAALQAAVSGRDEVAFEHLPDSLALPEASRRKSRRVAGDDWDYKLTLARAELELADRAIREKGIQQKTALAEALGYSDRFTFGRRLEKALRDFPVLAGEYEAVARMFERRFAV